ncbi:MULTISPECIES: SpoIIE family protein phosphatase [Streptomyces]|uniref:Serine phosphatase RsbU (Regulator of sigma subunit) n=1 Tax=Streptomyces nymphaeiformis TaxID=2663842 RepID=A0A7W7XFZ3_9ACTN|nr:SpoIIE family protein phosphatase [Streptomyces nymphaeiformis]MBB4986792.1 serine phosphatase RsbU (regulator of sigma subunit) [Streptomyces nymphaeiformis]
MEAEPAPSAGGASPEVLALAKVVSRLRAEVADLEAGAAAAAVLERASGVLMAREGISAEEARELLRDRAARHDRTLAEECWLTLGSAGRTPAFSPASPPPPAPVDAAPFEAARYAVRPADNAQHVLLARLADGLAVASTASEVAQLLLLVLGDAEQVDAVMIYALGGSGSLELTGHAGFDPSLTEQWSHVPPLAGVAAREALTEARAVWLENARLDADRYLLIGGPWPSRAWIPLPGERPTLAVGFFRTVAGPFSHGTRSLLRRAVRLCEGRLRDSGRPGAPASTDEDDSVVAVQGIFDALSGPAVLLTPMRSADGRIEDFRIDAAAPESVDVAGRRGRDLVGRRILETYPTVAGSDLWEGYLDTLTTGKVYEGLPFTYEETALGVPYESVYSVRASPLGGRLVVCWIRHDTSEREARRLDDLQRLGNLGWASWNLTTETITWSDQVYTIFARDPRLGPMPLEELPAQLVPDDLARLGAAVQRLLGDGTAIDEPFRIATAHGVRHLRIVAEAHTDSAGTPVEVHGFFQDLTAQRGAEIALRESERANLLQRGMLKAERALAARLQETLLPIPEQSLDLADLRVDVAYLPADTGVNVGGDWYSAIELPYGGALFVVGDVAGHGLTAVGTMAQLRFTAKGMAITGSKLPVVLSRLNALLLHTATESYSGTATMIMARYRPEDHQLTWVRAGHLPPLLIRDGTARYLAQPEGCLLGASFEAPYGQASLTLVPGDHLVLYTDGLVEVPHEDIDEGFTRLADTAARLVREGNARTLARTLAAGRPRHRDDICVLDIHLPRPESPVDEERMNPEPFPP